MKNGILACGFMRKETAERSQYHFSNAYYSCFVLLRGSGRYLSETGTSYQLQAGSLVQRLPGVPHSTIIHPDGKNPIVLPEFSSIILSDKDRRFSVDNAWTGADSFLRISL